MHQRVGPWPRKFGRWDKIIWIIIEIFCRFLQRARQFAGYSITPYPAKNRRSRAQNALFPAAILTAGLVVVLLFLQLRHGSGHAAAAMWYAGRGQAHLYT